MASEHPLHRATGPSGPKTGTTGPRPQLPHVHQGSTGTVTLLIEEADSNFCLSRSGSGMAASAQALCWHGDKSKATPAQPGTCGQTTQVGPTQPGHDATDLIVKGAVILAHLKLQMSSVSGFGNMSIRRCTRYVVVAREAASRSMAVSTLRKCVTSAMCTPTSKLPLGSSLRPK